MRRIKNNKSRKINCKGPLYCGQKTINFSGAKETTFCGLDQCISSYCNKKGFPKESSSESKYLVKNELGLEINTLRTKYIKSETSDMLYSDCIKDKMIFDYSHIYIYIYIYIIYIYV